MPKAAITRSLYLCRTNSHLTLIRYIANTMAAKASIESM